MFTYFDISDTFEEKRYTYVAFSVSQNVLRINSESWAGETPPNLGRVVVLGIAKAVTEVTVNNLSQAFKFDTIHKVISFYNLGFERKIKYIFSVFNNR